MLVDYCFELEDGELVFVEDEEGKDIDEVREYLEDQVYCGVEGFVGIYSVDEAEELGYDTF